MTEKHSCRIIASLKCRMLALITICLIILACEDEYARENLCDPISYSSIQKKINKAQEGDTILVDPGTYVGNIDFKGKDIVVASLFLTTGDTSYISQTILDGNQKGSVVRFWNGEGSGALLSGFTITNGSADYGGGISCIGSNPRLENLKVSGNTSEICRYIDIGGMGFGGGISLRNSSPSLVNVMISRNTADEGGGIYCVNSSPNLNNVTVSGNTAEYDGGGISLINSSPSLVNVMLNGNTAHFGGGINCSSSSPSLESITISGNGADNGGGIYFSGNSNPSFENVTVRGNTANLNGGGIYCYESNPNLMNVTVSGNMAHRGGGIYFYDSSPSFDNDNRCNIYLNNADSGNDLYTQTSLMINIVVDTFTVMNPTGYFAHPVNNFTFDILHAKLGQVDSDLYVSPSGNNASSGQSPLEPLRTISFALSIILTDNLHPHTIYLATGVYSPSTTGEEFPLNMISYVSLSGDSQDDVILDAESHSGVMVFDQTQEITIANLTVTGGSTYFGGGIYCSNSSPSLHNLSIRGNMADQMGGGIYCRDDSSPSLVNVKVSWNTAEYHGGGIYCRNNSNLTLENVTVSENRANNGSGIFCVNSNPKLVNVAVSRNTASDFGAGIFCFESNPSLVNTILWDNLPQEIYFDQYGNPNSITIDYSDVRGGSAGIVTNDNGTIKWLEGNIDEDPLFVNAENGDFHLQDVSPCIDAGNPDPEYNDPDGSRNDMGAYGGQNGDW
ncbi:MAG: hypothetical protein IIA61_04580 [Candidatus Marinimicrobia bacterium]|nr:hypothetical protein [Candidatus Neomarinimicrobiota bacterium]